MVPISKETFSESESESENSSGLLTPYQGKRRCFGQFCCDECNRSWFSANSWANTAQMCQLCDIRVYPFKQVSKSTIWEFVHSNQILDLRLYCLQWPLKKSGGIKKSNRKAHPQELCDKCKQLGHFCGQYNRAKKNLKKI